MARKIKEHREKTEEKSRKDFKKLEVYYGLSFEGLYTGSFLL